MKIQIKDVAVSDRGRKEFKNIREMADSIKTHGLIHPVVVSPREDGRYDLVAGERRLRGAILAGLAEVPATLRDDLDEVQIKEIELEENIQRSDLTWVEENEILTKIHQLKQQRHGEAGRGPGAKGWTLDKTADLTGLDKTNVSKRLQLARAMEENPQLKEKVSRLPMSAAMKYVRQEQERQRVERIHKSKELQQSDLLDFRHGDGLKLMASLEEGSIGLVLTDPPFGVEDIESRRETGGSQKLMNYKQGLHEHDNLSLEAATKLYVGLFSELGRVLKPGAHFYVFFSMDLYGTLRTLVKANGLECQSSPIIWYKERAMTPFMGYDYSSCYEPILYGWKPPRDRRLAEPAKLVLHYKPIGGEKLHHFEKPQDLLRFLVKQSSYVGEPVLDPFAGSGATLLAALATSRRAVGSELEKDHFILARERLNGQKMVSREGKEVE